MCPIRPGLATSNYHPRLVQIEILKTSYTLQGNQQCRRNIMLIHLKFNFLLKNYLPYLQCNFHITINEYDSAQMSKLFSCVSFTWDIEHSL